MSNKVDYSLPAYIRTRIANRQAENRYRRDSKPGAPVTMEKCPRCKQLYPLGELEGQLCRICDAELIDSNYDERMKWGRAERPRKYY